MPIEARILINSTNWLIFNDFQVYYRQLRKQEKIYYSVSSLALI